MKVYSPQVFDALAECLRTVYWFKEELKSFFVRCGVPREHIARLDWSYKRNAIRQLLDDLAAKKTSGTPLVGALVGGVVEQDESFPHLAKLEDGKQRVKDARAAVRRLKDLLGHQTVVARAEAARTERRTEAERQQDERRRRVEAVVKLKASFMELATTNNEQKRGYDFQPWLRELFALHDFEPRGSFASPGEQIDGSILLAGQLLLVEARWTKQMVEPADVRDFVGKLDQKLDNTLGLMVSVAGFTENAAAKATSGGRLLTVFMDGQDLFLVLEGLVDLRDLLTRKLRHAAEKGEPMYRVGT